MAGSLRPAHEVSASHFHVPSVVPRGSLVHADLAFRLDGGGATGDHRPVVSSRETF